MRNRKMWTIIVSGLFLSSIIAGISGAFLIIEGELTTLLWEVLPEVANPLLFCLVCARSVGIELSEETLRASTTNGARGADRIEGETIGRLFRCV